MNYIRAIDYLFGLQKFGIKLGLSNITSLLRYMGNPEKKLNCIHVGGTNGKGSTCAFLLSILKQSGYRAGLYTSPHLVDFAERIRINDKEISRTRVAALTEDIRFLCKQKSLSHITFFEAATAMAFKYFADEKADPVIVEVGMGGRYDATNVITPMISIITTINVDHQHYLGSTLAEIAREKAGIIKQDVPLVSGVRETAIKNYFKKVCTKYHAPFYQLGSSIQCRKTGFNTFTFAGMGMRLQDVQCGLAGDHQLRNASLAITAAELLNKQSYNVPQASILKGIKEVRWPGRMEIIRKNPTIVLDGAHNPEGWRALKRSLLNDFTYGHLYLVLGIMEDKNVKTMLKILTPGAHTVIFCRPGITRAAQKERIENFIRFSEHKKVFSWVEKSSEALKKILNLASKKDLICITGSLFLIGEIKEYLGQREKSTTSGRIGL